VLLPLGAMSAGSWHQQTFLAMGTNFLPILAIENRPNYDGDRLLNATLTIGVGMIAAAIFLRLLPPLSPVRRTRRLLVLTLRDLRRLATGQRRLENRAWTSIVSQRLGAMPEQATLEQEAELLAGLSVGEASIALLEARPHVTGGDALDHAFASLARANVVEAREWLARFCAHQSEGDTATAQRGMRAAVEAALIADALTQHADFFASVA
jgi:fusaric acid resistance family protein